MPSFVEQLQALHSNPNQQMQLIAQRIDDLAVTGGQGDAVALLGNTLDLVAGTPVAAALNATFSDTEVEAALNLKTDQADYSAMVAALETRLAAAEAKLDELIGSLTDSGQLA